MRLGRFIFWWYTFFLLPLLWFLLGVWGSLEKLWGGKRLAVFWRAQKTWRSPPARPEAPLLWGHAASVGELLQLQPLFERARKRGFHIIVSVRSTSSLFWLEKLRLKEGVLLAELAPLDFFFTTKKLLKHFQPKAFFYTQAELLPTFVWQSEKEKIPQFLLAARFNGNYRTHSLLWPFFQALYQPFTEIHALSKENLQKFRHLLPQHKGLSLGGDPGWLRLFSHAPTHNLSWKTPSKDKTTLLLGSLWPEDEEVLRPALWEWLKLPHTQLIVVPHLPEEKYLHPLKTTYQDFSPLLYSQIMGKQTSAPPKVLLVDKLGVLHALYSLANMAFVGGGFFKGTHNIAEPLAAGIPVFMGPKRGPTPLLHIFLEKGWVRVVENSQEVSTCLKSWDKKAVSQRLGQEAKTHLQAHLQQTEERLENILNSLEKSTKA